MMTILLINDTRGYDDSLIYNQSPMDMIRLLGDASEQEFGRRGELFDRFRHADMVFVYNGNQAVLLKDRGSSHKIEFECDQVVV
jgi:hypothetical protein